MTFSIIVVCLNAGEKLHGTIESILSQTERDYEIIIKDGGSSDEVTCAYLSEYGEHGETGIGRSEGQAPKESGPLQRIRVYRAKDAGIYDAMNQAVKYVRGDYVFFLNCGDRLYDDNVLAKVREQIAQRRSGRDAEEEKTDAAPADQYIFYGNIHEQRTDTFVASNPVIDDFACYRNLPCHQACFYSARLLKERGFDTHYAVRADYEHFLWCYYRARAEAVYMPVTVALYEGGGFSETGENRKRSAREHREIVSRYLPTAKVRRYRLLMFITLAPLRTWIAENPVTAGVYQKCKRRLYRGNVI